MVTDIMQESTDAIYKFEDDAISLADKILRDVLVADLRVVVEQSIDAVLPAKPSQSATDSDYDADHIAEHSMNSSRHLSARGRVMEPGKRLFDDLDFLGDDVLPVDFDERL